MQNSKPMQEPDCLVSSGKSARPFFPTAEAQCLLWSLPGLSPTESAFVVPLPAHTCPTAAVKSWVTGAGGSKRFTANDDNTRLDPREWVESCVECNAI